MGTKDGRGCELGYAGVQEAPPTNPLGLVAPTWCLRRPWELLLEAEAGLGWARPATLPRRPQARRRQPTVAPATMEGDARVDEGLGSMVARAT